jgi:TonB family protein
MIHHWKVVLLQSNRISREWSVWASTLKIGAHPKSTIVVPPPFPEKLVLIEGNGTWASLKEDGTVTNGVARSRDEVYRFSWGSAVIEVVEDTPLRSVLWEKARNRMQLALKLGWKEPGQDSGKTRAGVLLACALIGLLAMAGLVVLDHRPKPKDDALPDVVLQLVQEKQEEKKEEEKKPEPKEDAGGASDQKPTNPNEGGATETRTVAWPPSSPSAVMQNSVMDKINTASDGLLGEDVDPNEANMVDVILAGGGGSMKKGARGGHGAGGDGDRMAGVGGIGLGTGGRAGFGTGNGGTRQGKMALGAGGNGTGVSTRARISPPKPSDVELGGEAGSRSPESILRVIRSNIGGFQYSYQKYLRDNPNLGGKISLKFTIAPSGDIIQIQIVASNTGNSTLDDEIKDKARRMKFDQIEKGNVTVTYAFVLDKQ